MNRLEELGRLGQSVWLDFIRRGMLVDGGLAKLIRDDAVRGVTSNPSIFQKAIAGSDDYAGAIADLAVAGETNAEAAYEHMAIADIRWACDILASVYKESDGRDGYVSLEVSPHQARDTEGTLAAARKLWKAVDKPNLMIKVPATPEGMPAIEQLIGEGINVNVTLLFSLEAYVGSAEAYVRGLEARAKRGEELRSVASVASFFISRLDSTVDKRLEGREGGEALRGKAAVANAKLAYQHYLRIFAGEGWDALAARGARTQRVLWASTSTKNPSYPDCLYVDELIGPDTVNTLPPATLEAFRDHGQLDDTLTRDVEAARAHMEKLEETGIDLGEVTDFLLDQGVDLFVTAYDELIAAVGEALAKA